jgi:hypothetical protein
MKGLWELHDLPNNGVLREDIGELIRESACGLIHSIRAAVPAALWVETAKAKQERARKAAEDAGKEYNPKFGPVGMSFSKGAAAVKTLDRIGVEILVLPFDFDRAFSIEQGNEFGQAAINDFMWIANHIVEATNQEHYARVLIDAILKSAVNLSNRYAEVTVPMIEIEETINLDLVAVAFTSNDEEILVESEGWCKYFAHSRGEMRRCV